MPMSILDTMRKQTAVYWPPAGLDEQGRQTYDTPQEMRVRFDKVTEVFLNRSNEQQVSKAKVMMEGGPPDEDPPFETEGLLWEGTLDGLTAQQEADPVGLVPDVAQIERVDEIPTLEADQTLYIAYL